MPLWLGLHELFEEGVIMIKFLEVVEMFLTHIPKVIEYYAETGLPVIPVEELPEAIYSAVYLLGTRVIPLLLAYFVLP